MENNLINIKDAEIENARLNDDDEIVIRRTNKDGTKSKYLIELSQLVSFLTNCLVTSNGDDIVKYSEHRRNCIASAGL